MRMNEKRGQIALFIILGIVLMLIIGLVIYISYKGKSSEAIPGRTTVSERFEPIQLFVEDCIASVAREAIEKLGKHGGYIDPNDVYLSGRLFDVNNQDQTENDLLYLSKDIEKAIPYWLYSYDYTGCDNCLILSQAPYLDEIERQISIYVSENIDYCLENLEQFIKQGYEIKSASTLYANTIIRDKDVFVTAIYPINVTYKNEKTTIERYEAIVDIPLLKYYELAINITARQYNSQFLEGLTTYILLSHSGLDYSLLPPWYAYSSQYSVVMWSKTSVKNTINQLLLSYMPLMQVKGAKNYHQIRSNNLTLLEKNFIDLITLDLFPDRDLKNTEISFLYMGEDLYFDIQPSKDELLGPFENYGIGSDYSFAPPEKSNLYQFFYDISYPVIVEIRDEYKPGQIYTFMFALETNIKQNLPLKEWWNESKKAFISRFFIIFF
ncbi:MAG: hypothetical protein KatS3mg002_0961 [Candidatus Woesearchaeota archaeon]|nr:MAG: hypothetical protein KatS3mg002_0961 [Candidatus Woesearchaeota archaeon]